jgi:tight adherence protein C
VRPVRLVDRVAPYLGDTPPLSRLLARPTATAVPFVVVRRLFGPVIGDAVAFLDRVVGGSVSVRRGLGGLGSGVTVEELRIEQEQIAGFYVVERAEAGVGLLGMAARCPVGGWTAH